MNMHCILCSAYRNYPAWFRFQLDKPANDCIVVTKRITGYTFYLLTTYRSRWTTLWLLIIWHDLTSTSLSWHRGWQEDKDAHGVSSVLVYSNNLPYLLTTLSTTYTHALSLKNTDLFCSYIIFTLVALTHSSGNLFQSFGNLWENVYFLIS